MEQIGMIIYVMRRGIIPPKVSSVIVVGAMRINVWAGFNIESTHHAFTVSEK